MTIDPETKKYIDNSLVDMSMKFSAFLSTLCNTLEEKKIIGPGEFEEILEKSKRTVVYHKALSAGNLAGFAKIFEREFKEFEKKLQKEAKDRKDWADLK